MSKRFIESEIWLKEWFQKLNAGEKLAVRYIMENCDNVGVWTPNKGLAEYLIGDEIDWSTLPDKTNGNIEILDNGKWFVVDYFYFQHGDFDLDSKNKAHISYIKLLKKHGIYDRFFKESGEGVEEPGEGLEEVNKESIKTPPKGSKDKVRVKDRVRVREKDKEKEKDGKIPYAEAVRFTKKEYDTLIKKFGAGKTALAIEILNNYKLSKGKNYKSDYHTMYTWVMKEVEKQYKPEEHEDRVYHPSEGKRY